jgi:NADH-quinone oxidoreductase subunit N
LFSGFIGKFLIFGSVLKSQSYLWLALLGVLNSVVSLYYYAKILRAMWLEGPSSTESQAVKVPVSQAIGLVALAAPTIVLGLFFSPVLEFAQRLFQ